MIAKKNHQNKGNKKANKDNQCPDPFTQGLTKPLWIKNPEVS